MSRYVFRKSFTFKDSPPSLWQPSFLPDWAIFGGGGSVRVLVFEAFRAFYNFFVERIEPEHHKFSTGNLGEPKTAKKSHNTRKNRKPTKKISKTHYKKIQNEKRKKTDNKT